jgi:hypothetical protein
MVMVILSMFSWWYVDGFRDQLRRVKMMLARVNDQFSIPLLLKTLFQPFRQISNEKVDGALEDKMQAWLDRMVSRLIGGFIRTVVMIIGLICLVAVAILSAIRLVLWVLMPVLPFVAILLINWVGIPWK